MQKSESGPGSPVTSQAHMEVVGPTWRGQARRYPPFMSAAPPCTLGLGSARCRAEQWPLAEGREHKMRQGKKRGRFYRLTGLECSNMHTAGYQIQEAQITTQTGSGTTVSAQDAIAPLYLCYECGIKLLLSFVLGLKYMCCTGVCCIYSDI